MSYVFSSVRRLLEQPKRLRSDHLSREEQVSRVLAIQSALGDEQELLMRELTERYRGAIINIAMKFRPYDEPDFRHLVCAGEQALRQAVLEYDASWGTLLFTWAGPKIYWGIRDAAEKRSFAAAGIGMPYHRAIKAKRAILLGDEDELEETSRQAARVLSAKVVKLDHEALRGGGRKILAHETIMDDRIPPPEEQLHEHRRRRLLVKAANTMTERERLVYYYRVLVPLVRRTLPPQHDVVIEKLRERFGRTLSSQRISQLEFQALQKVRAFFESLGLSLADLLHDHEMGGEAPASPR